MLQEKNAAIIKTTGAHASQTSKHMQERNAARDKRCKRETLQEINAPRDKRCKR